MFSSSDVLFLNPRTIAKFLLAQEMSEGTMAEVRLLNRGYAVYRARPVRRGPNSAKNIDTAALTWRSTSAGVGGFQLD